MENRAKGARKHLVITAALLVAALAMTALGVKSGEPFEVMQKAVNICLECIGVG